MSASSAVRWGTAAAVFVIAGAASLGFFQPGRIFVGPDAIEHVAIANAFATGHGFVNPVQWYYTLPGPPPIAAAASRAPLMPFLLAVPFWLGANLQQAMYAHIFFSTLIVVGMFWLGSRFMRPLFAAAAALALGLTGTWQLSAATPHTEATAVGAFLLVVATAPGAGRSAKGAILCGLVTVLAWLARPNLAPLGLAVVVALAVDLLPPRRARWWPMALYVVVWVGATSLVSSVSAALTGHVPYEAYGHTFEHFPANRALQLNLEYVGTVPFVLEHWQRIVAAMASNASALGEVLFLRPTFFFAGWALLYGAISIGRAPVRASVEERVLLLAALGFCVIIILTYPVMDVQRYPLFPAVAGLLIGFAALDRALRAMEPRWALLRSPQTARVAYAALLLVCLATVVPLWTVPPLKDGASEVPGHGLCELLEPGHLVMTDEPWTIHWQCGNPSVRVPANLKNLEIRSDALARFRPAYFVPFRKAWRKWALRQPDLALQVPSEPSSEGRLVYAFIGRGEPTTIEPLDAPVCLADARPPLCRKVGG